MFHATRRGFLSGGFGGLAAALAAGPILLADDGQRPEPGFAPDTLFLTWRTDPCTTMVIQWLGEPATSAGVAVFYAEVPLKPVVKTLRDAIAPPAVIAAPVWQEKAVKAKPFAATELNVYRCELTGLKPGTQYMFRLGAQSPTYFFQTMPAKATDSFTFVSGGDCGVNEHALANNRLAAQQDPMFVIIGGDLGYDNGKSAAVAIQFIRNYSKTMIDTQGRLIPLITCIGNHEVLGSYNKTLKEATYFHPLFDTLYEERSFATLDFGNYLSFVLLDTGHAAPISGEQTDWLNKALADRVGLPNLFVVNHVPAYPSYRAPDAAPSKDGKEAKLGTGEGNRRHWAPLFEKYQVDAVLEHHDHTFKRTHPLKDGRPDPLGIIYLGDGSWGKLRAAKKPEDRPYLAKTHDAYHMTMHRIEGERRFHVALADTGKVVDIITTHKKPRMKRPTG
jgi:acid phosphatase type 7